MRELFALTILRLINLGFRTSANGRNPVFHSVENSKGHTIYIGQEVDCVTISASKVSRTCLRESITDISQLEGIVDKLKDKVKCDDLEIYPIT